MDKNMLSYTRDDHTVIHGDTLTVLEEGVTDHSVNLIFADPPYNIGKQFSEFADKWESDEAYIEWCQQWLEICIRKLHPQGTLYIMMSTQSMPYIDLYLRKRLSILSRIIWHYDSSGVQAKNFFGSLYEPILHAVKNPKAYTFNAGEIEVEAKTGAIRNLIDYRGSQPKPYNRMKVPGNVWEIPRVRYRMDEYENHPTQKPEALLERIILASSNIGDLVLDPFAGTFTTCAVAQRLGRRSIGIELQRDYIKIGVRRLGIVDELDGETLQKTEKSYHRKNAKLDNQTSDVYTSDLFGNQS